MTKASLMAMSVVLGVATGSIGLAIPASAIQLNLVQQGDSTPEGWTSLGWKVEGRAGAPGSEDYEFAIGTDGAQSNNTGQIYRDWTNGQDVNWSLNWDGQAAEFRVENLAPISYSLSAPSPNIFNGFYLLSNVITEPYTSGGVNQVEQGTNMEVLVKTVNGENVGDVFTSATGLATPAVSLDKKYFSSSTAITSLAGTAKMSWLNLDPNTIRARSRVDFQIVGFNTQAKPPTSVPEPASLLGLLALGAFGAGSVLKRERVRREE